MVYVDKKERIKQKYLFPKGMCIQKHEMNSGKLNTKKMTQASFGEISTTGVKVESRRTFDFSPPWFNSDLASY